MSPIPFPKGFIEHHFDIVSPLTSINRHDGKNRISLIGESKIIAIDKADKKKKSIISGLNTGSIYNLTVPVGEGSTGAKEDSIERIGS